MTEKEFLQEIAKASDDRKFFVEDITSHGVPIIIFGAGVYASEVTKILNECNVKVDGYLVDDEYYKPDSLYLNRPMYSFSEIFGDKSKRCVLIRGFGNSRAWKNVKDKVSTQSQIAAYSFIIEYFYTMTYDDVLSEKDKFFETYNLLEDELSKKTFITCLRAHLSLVPIHLKNIVATNEYFNELTRPSIKEKWTLVDCGAYRGDTVEKFIKFSNGNYEKIFAIEPDEKSFVQLEKFVEDSGYKDIVLCNLGVCDKKGIVTFENYGHGGSKISEIGESTINTDTIDNIVGDTRIDLIKMDIEGSELSALKGAVNTLQRCRPILALSVYHRKEDLITIPQFVKKVYKNCRFYLRQYRTIDVADLDLYYI